ncbi:unnamed protein product [Clonostachys rhizophaga]|uniref:Amino acid permease/ SLC12A domain-containing protein n=1 Tax=Clonostachys rhizophaga TaxID=160324 RepID=A0A9N9W2E2_9HYPO|nr:unnamed protein product [Clonostachys rhizophaga]
MNVVNPAAGTNASKQQHNATKLARDAIFQNEEDLTGGWFTALAASIYIASFSYVGVEIVAGTAQEAKFVDSKANESTSGGILNGPSNRERSSTKLKDPFEFSLWVPMVTTVIYVWGGWIVSENIYWNDERLPASVWSDGKTTPNGESRSIFVIANKDSGSANSATTSTALTAFLIVHVLSTSTSSLYVASRTLFGLAYTSVKSRGHTETTLLSRFLDILVRKSKFDVPYVAILVSAWLCWLPFLKYGFKAAFLDVRQILISSKQGA